MKHPYILSLATLGVAHAGFIFRAAQVSGETSNSMGVFPPENLGNSDLAR